MDKDSELYTWSLEVEALMFANVKPFLTNLAKERNCSIKFLKNDSTFWKDKLAVKFTGTNENLKALQEDFILSMTKYNLPSNLSSGKYKIDTMTELESNSSREIIFEVKASKRSRVKELAEAIADELDLFPNVGEKSNGFLKGKTIHVSASGDMDKLKNFKAIFQSILFQKEIAQHNKAKLKRKF